MTISVGDTLPEFTFMTPSDTGPSEINSADLFAGNKTILFGVPGAFTPTCHANHLPGFVEHFSTLQDMGVDNIAVLSVNDVHVMNAWRESIPGSEHIQFLADGSAHYTKKLGLVMDGDAFAMGVRCQRFSMIVEDGVVKNLNVEDVPSKADVSSAANIMAQLKS